MVKKRSHHKPLFSLTFIPIILTLVVTIFIVIVINRNNEARRSKAETTLPSCTSFSSININNCTSNRWKSSPLASQCKTTSRSVTLYLNSAGATSMRFVEVSPASTDCATVGESNWGAWESYAATKAWRLINLDSGNHKVCAQFRNSTGSSGKCFGMIKYTGDTSGGGGGGGSPMPTQGGGETAFRAKKWLFRESGKCELNTAGGEIDFKYYSSFTACKNAIAPIMSTGSFPSYDWAHGQCNPLTATTSYLWECTCSRSIPGGENCPNP